MPRANIDIGIDLGTTNSAIAIIQQGTPFVVPNNEGGLTTPSAVRINKSGTTSVGRAAYDLLVGSPENAVGAFKRWMGTERTMHFADAEQYLSAPQLSALILQSLKGDAERQTGEPVKAAVITVPAAFDLVQTSATQDAARLAGIEQSPLLQEPIAASLAYGYRIDMEGGQWLVYDLGGGTFDLALVGVHDGRVQVLDHAGDNFLGGTDLDWVIVEKLLVPQLARQFHVAGFTRANGARRATLATLKALAEKAKIELSRNEAATVTIETLRKPMLDDEGTEIECDIALTRRQYEEAITPLIERTVALSHSVLERNPNVSPDAVLMVGGPTLTPLIRRLVGERLGIAVNASANPLTVVAEGAALFAATQPLTVRTITPSSRTRASLDLKYKSVTDDEQTLIGAAVPDHVASLEFAASDRSWSSGQVPVREGRVISRLPLPRKGAHQFEIVARSSDGAIVSIEPDQVTITRGLTAAAAPLPHPLGVVITSETGEDSFDEIVRRGAPLPARGTKEFRVARTLGPAGDLDVVTVYVLEGDSSRPDRNHKVAEVSITNRMVTRRVGAGNPIEVTIEIDESRLLTASVYVPVLDQTFTATHTMRGDEARAEDLREKVDAERERVTSLAEHVPASTSRELHEELRTVDVEVRASAAGDPDTLQRALRNLQEVQRRVDAYEDAQKVPRAVASAHEEAAMAGRIVTEHGNDEQKIRLNALTRDLDAAVASSSPIDMRRVEEKLSRLRMEVLLSIPYIWAIWFKTLVQEARGWTDEDQADRLIRQGLAQIEREDMNGLRGTFFELEALVPPDDRARMRQFQNVGIRRS